MPWAQVGITHAVPGELAVAHDQDARVRRRRRQDAVLVIDELDPVDEQVRRFVANARSVHVRHACPGQCQVAHRDMRARDDENALARAYLVGKDRRAVRPQAFDGDVAGLDQGAVEIFSGVEGDRIAAPQLWHHFRQHLVIFTGADRICGSTARCRQQQQTSDDQPSQPQSKGGSLKGAGETHETLLDECLARCGARGWSRIVIPSRCTESQRGTTTFDISRAPHQGRLPTTRASRGWRHPSTGMTARLFCLIRPLQRHNARDPNDFPGYSLIGCSRRVARGNGVHDLETTKWKSYPIFYPSS